MVLITTLGHNVQKRGGSPSPAQTRLLITDDQWRLLFEQTQVQVRQHGEMLRGILGELKAMRATVREAAPAARFNQHSYISK